MNRKVIIGIVAVLIIAVVAVLGYSFLSNDSDDNNVNNENNNSNNVTNNEDNTQDDNIGSVLGKTLIVYYSATGNTKEVAEEMADDLNADTFEIVSNDSYTDEDLDWTDDNSRVSREYNDESLRDVELENTTVPLWDSYDTVLIGYPIWWGIAAWPVDTFVEANDFSGKTVIPFCTSASSGLGQSGELLADLAGEGNWLEGYRFSSNPSDSEISSWTDSLR